jgi:hypothetical protein
VKVFFLGNSNELYGDVEADGRRASRVAEALELAFGEPVEMLVRPIWPTAALPKTIAKWIDESEPDIIYLNVVAFWFNYRSVPLKFERMFGKAGEPFKRAGIKASQVSWLGHTAAFHWFRERTLRLIGGATFFEPDHVAAVMEASIRTIVRKESAVLVVKGPRSRSDYSASARSPAWAEERRSHVHRALSRLCEELHVDYVGVERPRYLTDPETDLLGDRLHTGSDGHARSADEISGMLKAAWERQHVRVETERRR